MERAGLQEALADLEPIKEEQQIKVTVDRDLESQLVKLHRVYQEKNPYDNTGYYVFYKKYLQRVSKMAITPKLIEGFSQDLYMYQKDSYFAVEAGLFLTALVQAAYAQGGNGFTIYTAGLATDIEEFGLYSKYEKDRPLVVSVMGDLGHNCGHIEYVKLNIYGNTGNFLSDFHFSEIYVSGNCGNLAFFQSSDIKVRVAGNAGVQFGGSSQNSSFVLGGNTGGSCGSYSTECKFEIRGDSGPNLAVGASRSKFTCRPPHRISKKTPPVDCVFEETK
ncbi:MAG: hypothetical protein HY438_00755 [DPANN group archaeon]|nr:hypothetical protein [DPANN group archaeon]